VPFRPINVDVAFGQPELLIKAGPQDIEMQVSCTTHGSTGVSAGPNYIVGTKQPDGTVAGKFVSANEFTTDLADGDELWVAAAEQLAFTGSIRITGLVRTQ
jgi:hypothetical protein